LGILVLLSALTGTSVAIAIRAWPQADPALAASGAVGEQLGQQPWIRRFLRARLDPRVATGLALTAAMAGLVVAGTILGLFAYMIRTNTGVVRLDLRVARWASTHVTGVSFQLIRAITQLGSTPSTVLVGLLVAGYGAWRWRRASVFWFMACVMGGEVALMNLVKFLVGRARPDILPLTGFSGASFPSGHASAAASTFAAAALVLSRGRSPRVRAVVSGIAVALAVAVASSRVLLGVHWFSDVIGGLVLGWAWVAICSIAFGGRLLRFGAPGEIAASTPPGGSDPPGSDAGRTRPVRSGRPG
jgi:undecaprenyl-diphosphatase